MLRILKDPRWLSTSAFLLVILLTGMFSFVQANSPDTDHLVFEGKDGPGKGKHVVLLAGDEEYRSEEALPMMGMVLAEHGFKCTV
ncbi:hypothetical protein N9B73_13065, partial [Verrucomicrobiales bacterium]|nr:hypothetical protein [Verrucomicrobiales bacterium]